MRHIVSLRSVAALTLLAWATAATVAASVYTLGRLIDALRGNPRG